MRIVFYGLLLSLFIPTLANAKLYKCTDQDGAISFQQEPCSAEQTTDWEKVTKQEKREQQLEKEQLEQARRILAERQVKEAAERAWQPSEIPDHIKTSILEYLDAVLKDPDSLKDLNWVAARSNGEAYRVRVTFRAKNGWGAYGISDKTFKTTMNGKIIWSKESDKVNWHKIR